MDKDTDDLDIITRDGERLRGAAARKYLDRHNAVADAILMERAAEAWLRKRPGGVAAWLNAEEIAYKLRARAAELRREVENDG